LKDRQQSLIAAAIISALSLPGCTPDTRGAQSEPSASPRAHVSHGGGYYGGSHPRDRGSSDDEGDGGHSADGSHGGFGEAGAAGDAGG
jgi:hypothetical protein